VEKPAVLYMLGHPDLDQQNRSSNLGDLQNEFQSAQNITRNVFQTKPSQHEDQIRVAPPRN